METYNHQGLKHNPKTYVGFKKAKDGLSSTSSLPRDEEEASANKKYDENFEEEKVDGISRTPSPEEFENREKSLSNSKDTSNLQQKKKKLKQDSLESDDIQHNGNSNDATESEDDDDSVFDIEFQPTQTFNEEDEYSHEKSEISSIQGLKGTEPAETLPYERKTTNHKFLAHGDSSNSNNGGKVNAKTKVTGKFRHCFIDEAEKKCYYDSLAHLVPIGKRFCVDCNVDQPVRAKHCKVCGYCMATFDHHCIWVGNCIGERNRPVFIVFLVLQIIELAFATVKIPDDLDYSNLVRPEMLVLFSSYIFIIFFLINVGILLAYHIKLMTSNQTTWEYLKGDNISYLDDFDLKKGSPFDQGERENVKLYFYPPSEYFYLWEGKKTLVRAGGDY